MKVNALGKVFFGLCAANVALALYNGLQAAKEVNETPLEFSEEDISSLVVAAAEKDYSTFEKLYKSRRPWATNVLVVQTYGFFLKNAPRG